MRRVIVNTTPILALGNIGRLDILRGMYERIIIPSAVFAEATERDDPAARALLTAGNWIDVQTAPDGTSAPLFRAKLHAGEVGTMLLALQPPVADLVILDDGAARKTAEFLGLRVTGTVGVLVKAKKLGLIPAVRPLIEEISRNGFYISERLMRDVLTASQEL